MSELTNQECRDLKGSLSDRGCYFDKYGKPTESIKKAKSFSCLDCGKNRPISKLFRIVENLDIGIVVRPICGSCYLRREGL